MTLPFGPGRSALRVAFAGTPAFARQALQGVFDAGHELVLVLTQPDRPAGRGLKLQSSPVKQLALERGCALAQPRGLRLDGRWGEDAAAARAALHGARPDVIVVAAYGLILPTWVLELPRYGCLNIHASLLPRWRGAAPIQRAIEAGDERTGITIMQMDAGLDTGDLLLAEPVAIAQRDSAATLHDRLAEVGARLIVQALERLAGGGLPRTPQPEHGASYAAKIDKAEAAIDWRAPAALIERRVRAFDPAPGASFTVDGESWKLWRAALDPRLHGPPGTVSLNSSGIAVACGEGGLDLLELQRPGGRRAEVGRLLPGLITRLPMGRVLPSAGN